MFQSHSAPHLVVLTFSLTVPPRPTSQITYPGKGDEQPGRPADDLVLIVREQPHPTFTRRWVKTLRRL